MTGILGVLLSVPWWASLFIIIVVLLLVVELGFRLGRSAANKKKSTSGLSVFVGALVTLLALLLGFAFNMAESRLFMRKAIIIDEANAIGTSYLRAKTLPEPHSTRVKSDLREYVGLRITANTPEELELAIRKSDVIHQRLWAEVVAVSQANPQSEVVGRFLASINDVIDLHTKRLTVGLYQRIPKAIVSVIALVTLLSMLMLGYWSGLKNSRVPFLASLALIISIGFCVVMINEIDTPGTPMLDVTKKALEDLQQTIEKDIEHLAAPALIPSVD